MTDSASEAGQSPRRIEAMTDGIYAVAMTLLVIELKFPERVEIHTAADLARSLAELGPKLISWLLSFMVLALFWYAHHRTFNHVRQVSGRLVALNLAQLACVSLMPFSSALVGEYGGAFLSQLIYSANMVVVALFSQLLSRHIYRHPGLSSVPMSRGAYRGTQVRNFALVAISAIAVVVGYFTLPALGNIAYALMAVVMPLSRRLERRAH
jgi:uncharacterized membrane protein